MIIGEVVETKTAFKPKQKDNNGNALALGSIQVRIGSNAGGLGQVRNVYARPAVFMRRIPLIGEQVMLMPAPVNSETTDLVSGIGYIYWQPINATDDLVLHQFPHLSERSQSITGRQPANRYHDRDKVGYTFPNKPKKTSNIQPFEGDDIFEGRLGQSIRFGSSVQGKMSVYQERPTWKGGSNTDPLMILRVKKPSGQTKIKTGDIGKDFKSTSRYTVENISDDDASIYIATTQMIPKFKAGFKKNLDVKTAANWSGKSQIIVDAERVILNANKDKAFLIGSEEAVVTGKKVLLQSDKYKVDLDTLMDFLKSWLDSDTALAQGTSQYSTAAGPTAVATNMGDYLNLKLAEWQTFKLP